MAGIRNLFTAENALLLLLVFVPIAIALELAHASAVAIFASSSIAIIPLAGLMGRATEQIAARLGEGLGGLMNATFGNAAELIIAILALRAGLTDVVKASITGSIIGNVLLVFGLSALVGGLRYPKQTFNRTAASHGSTLLLLSVVGLVVPALFHTIVGTESASQERQLSVEIAVVLMLTYCLGLVFTLRTHRHLYDAGGGEHHGEVWPIGRAVGLLLGATAVIALMSEFLVGAIEQTAERFGMTEVFVGVIVVAIVGNAAEHSTAILVAAKNKMDLAINIAVGSSIQIALFVAPLLVFLSYVVGPSPMDLRFTTFEVLAVAASVTIIAQISQDGQTNWMEGVQLLAVYVILAIAFFFLPM